MEKIRGWLAKRGFELRLGGRLDRVNFNEMTVYVSTRQSAKQRLHSALHECGHVVLFGLRAQRKRHAYAGAAWSRWARSRQRSMVERILVLEEEVEAWRRGEALGRRLRLRLAPIKAQETHRARCLETYARWVAARPRRKRSP